MNAQDINDIAESFRKARLTQQPISTPPSAQHPSLSVQDAMKIQRACVDMAIKEGGDRVVGYKLGNVAKVMQEAFGVDEPDYGFLLASSFLYEGSKMSLKSYIAPFVELEPAFVLKSPLKGPNATAADVISAIEYVVPAVEIIDSRVKDWTITLQDTLADSGSNGGIILGGQPKRVEQLDLGDCKGKLVFNGVEVARGTTRNILGNPYAAVAWLVNRVAEFGIGFEAGQVVLPGSCLEAMPMREPGRWECTYEGWGTIVFDVTE